MLEVRGVATFYGAIQALHGVDLDVGKGEIVTLIGANGAGKSTLLMTVFGNPRARSGTIRLEGEDITQLPTHEIVRQIFGAIGRIAREEGVTIFLVEQNAYHALRLADRGYVLVNGRVRLSGTGRELLANAEIRSAYLEGGHA